MTNTKCLNFGNLHFLAPFGKVYFRNSEILISLKVSEINLTQGGQKGKMSKLQEKFPITPLKQTMKTDPWWQSVAFHTSGF